VIFHFVPGIYEEASGPSYTVPRLCESLIARGVDITLLTLDYGPLKSSMTYAKLFAIGSGPRKLGRSPSMWRFTKDQCAYGGVQLLHNHSLWMMPNVYPGWAARQYRLPYIVSPRGVFTEYALSIGSRLKPAFWNLLQRPSLSEVTCFHATAVSEYEDIRRMGYSQPIAIIPNGIDVPQAIAGHNGANRTLLFLGRIHPNKGVKELLQAWLVVSAELSDWTLKIVGDSEDDYLETIKSFAASLNIPRVVFTGSQYGEAKYESYRAADAYILPSFSENFGITVAEALANGIPAIVTHGAPWSGLKENEAGYWVGMSQESLTNAIRKIGFCGRDERRRMGGNGRSWMSREYSWDGIAEATSALYDWQLGQGSMPPCVVLE
jgi:glycosyltransferase involved in cell wall biosynthesis